MLLVGCCCAHSLAPAAAQRASSGRLLHCGSTVCRVRTPIAQVQQQAPAAAQPLDSTKEAEFKLAESADASFLQNYGVENTFSTAAYDMVTSFSQAVVNARPMSTASDELKERQVSTALNKMRRDINSLDTSASSRSQLTSVELLVLTSTVIVSAGAALSEEAQRSGPIPAPPTARACLLAVTPTMIGSDADSDAGP